KHERHRAERDQYLGPHGNVGQGVAPARVERRLLAAEEEQRGGHDEHRDHGIPRERGERPRRKAPAPLNPLWPAHRRPFHTYTLIHQEVTFAHSTGSGRYRTSTTRTSIRRLCGCRSTASPVEAGPIAASPGAGPVACREPTRCGPTSP